MNTAYDESMRAKRYLPFKMGYLTDEMVAQAQTELGETEATRVLAIAQMRELVQEDKKLTFTGSDEFLLQYLRARKFNVKKAFTLLQNTFLVKKSYPDVYDDCKVDSFRKVFKNGCPSCLPYRDHEGCVIITLQMYKWDPDVDAMLEILRTLTLLAFHCVDDPATQVCGARIVLDVRGASLKQLRCLTPRYLHLFSRALRNCLPIRFKSIHMFNESTIFQHIWSILKLLLTEKIRKRVHFHGDNQKQLHNIISKDLLPLEYGGNNPYFDTSDWYQKDMEGYYETFMNLLKSGYHN